MFIAEILTQQQLYENHRISLESKSIKNTMKKLKNQRIETIASVGVMHYLGNLNSRYSDTLNNYVITDVSQINS